MISRWERYNVERPRSIDVPSNKCTLQVQRAKVFICTTGVILQSAQSFQPVAYQHLRRSNILICEEAQQLGEVKNAYAQALTRRDCFHFLATDDKQSQGGLAPGHALAVRERLSVLTLGLRSNHKWRAPDANVRHGRYGGTWEREGPGPRVS